MSTNGGYGHEHAEHEHAEHEHEHEYALEAREKQVVMSFIEALVEGRLSVNARRAVYGILSLDPLLQDAHE